METTWTSKRVGNWVLQWEPTRPKTVWAVPEYLVSAVCGCSGIMYDDGTMAWDNPYKVPAYVRNAAPQFVRKCQGKRVAR
jgi:hypothetical protein